MVQIRYRCMGCDFETLSDGLAVCPVCGEQTEWATIRIHGKLPAKARNALLRIVRSVYAQKTKGGPK